jgi:hypothetical protein
VGTGFAHNATTQKLRAFLRFRLKAKRSKVKKAAASLMMQRLF